MSLFKLNDIALKGKGNLIGAHSNLKVSRLKTIKNSYSFITYNY